VIGLRLIRQLESHTLNSFDGFGLAEPISRALVQENYVTPTPIQAQTVPIVLEGRDVIGIAQTGTGKTAAFALPILHRLANSRTPLERKTCRVLVLSPTRELSSQILDSFNTYGRHLGLSATLAIGGVPMGKQVRALMNGVDVLVATPGRVLDLVNSNALRLTKVEVFVLDEADRMLDMGFIHDIRRIVAKMPAQRQTLLFSATMPQAAVLRDLPVERLGVAETETARDCVHLDGQRDFRAGIAHALQAAVARRVRHPALRADVGGHVERIALLEQRLALDRVGLNPDRGPVLGGNAEHLSAAAAHAKRRVLPGLDLEGLREGETQLSHPFEQRHVRPRLWAATGALADPANPSA
jgi:hypothetical protein